MPRAFLSLLCGSLLLLSSPLAPARAEDAESPASPAEAYKATVAALGVPTKEAGFRFAGVLRWNGQPAGQARISALPMKSEDGTLRWRAKDALMIRMGAKRALRVTTVHFDQHLVPLQGSLRGLAFGQPDVDWVRTETGVQVTVATTEGDVTEQAVHIFKLDDTALSTLAASVLFCRTVLDKPGRYATNVLEVRDALKGEPILQKVVFEVEGKVTLPGGHTVLAVTGKKGDETLRLLFDPETREPVAIRMQTPKGKIEVLAADKWELPATSAKFAALRTALGLATRNMGILDDVTHWETLHKRAMAARSEEAKKNEGPDLESFRANVLAKWEEHLPQNAPEMIKSVLEASADQIQLEELEGGLVRAVFPETFRGVQMLLGQDGGIWYLAELLSAKK